MRNLASALAFLLATAAFASEPAVEAAAEAPAKDLPTLEVSLKAGGHFPQVMNKLETSFDGILKAGYFLTESRQLQLFVDLGYSRPSQTLADNDPRLGDSGADYTSTLVLHDLATTLGFAYFFRAPTTGLVPYAGGGLRAHFLRAEVEGAAASAFGLNTETDTQVGAVAFGGAALRLGPGMLLGELAVGYAPAGQRVTGPANIGAASLLLGYGILL